MFYYLTPAQEREETRRSQADLDRRALKPVFRLGGFEFYWPLVSAVRYLAMHTVASNLARALAFQRGFGVHQAPGTLGAGFVLTGEQAKAVRDLIAASDTLPMSRMEYVAGVLEHCQTRHGLDTPAADELRALGAAESALAAAFARAL